MAQVITMPQQQAERTTFVGVIISKEIKALAKLLKKTDKALFSALLACLIDERSHAINLSKRMK